MKRTMAVILAGGEGERLSILSGVRAKPAVPFGGKYRIIDFTLSNCVNSDIDNVVVLTQYNPRSLNDHIGLGRPWDLDRNRGGVKLLQPYIARGRVAEWYRGTADAVYQNFNVIEHEADDTILVLAGDHIYKMDYQPFIAAHRRHRADVTIAVRRVPARRGVPDGDPRPRRQRPGHRVAGEAEAAQERPRLDGRLRLLEAGAPALAQRGPRRLRPARRSRRCSTAAPASSATASTATGRTSARSSRTGRRTSPCSRTTPELDLYDKDWVIHTRSEERAPAKVGPTAQVHRSLISHGCVINGTVVNTVLSPGVRVDVGAVVRDSIVMFDSVIRSGAVVDRSILDKEVVVGQGAIVGDGPDFDTPNRQEPRRLNTGITVVGKRAIIPRGTRIGRNVKIAGDVKATDFVSKVVRERGVGRGRRRQAAQATQAAAAAAAESKAAARTRARRGRTAPGRASGSRSPAAPAGCRRSRGARPSHRACTPARIAMRLPRRPGRVAARP